MGLYMLCSIYQGMVWYGMIWYDMVWYEAWNSIVVYFFFLINTYEHFQQRFLGTCRNQR